MRKLISMLLLLWLVVVVGMTAAAHDDPQDGAPLARQGAGVFFYYNSIAHEDLAERGVGIVRNIVTLQPDGTPLIEDGVQLWYFSELGGQILTPYPYEWDRPIPDHLIVSPDGTFWGYAADDGLVTYDVELNFVGATGRTVFTGADVQDIAIDADGTVYVFGTTEGDDEALTGTMFVFDADRTLMNTVVTNGDPSATGSVPFATGVSIFPQSDGSLLLVDLGLNRKVIDSDGNLLEDPRVYGDPDTPIVALTLDVADDGTLYALTEDAVLQQYTATGELLTELGRAQSDVDGPFVEGELPTDAMVWAWGQSYALVLGNNANHTLITLIDYTIIE